MNKKLVSITLSMALFVFTTLSVHGEELKTGKFFLKNIVINGVEITNYNLSHPFILYEDATYMPMSAEIGEICGFTAEYNSQNRILKLRETATLKNNLSQQLPQNKGEDLTITSISDIIVLKMDSQNVPFDSGTILQLGAKPAMLINDTLYLPLRTLASESGLGWDLYYDSCFGICISTNAGISADRYFSQDRTNYNRQLQSYILSKNAALGPTLALDYAFIFLRAAEVNQLDIKLLLAVAQNESNFKFDAVSRSGATGIMQIMPKTGKSLGLTPAQLFDPKLNIFYGAAYIKQQASRFDDNIGLALSAYAMGSGAVSRGAYSRSYVEKIHSSTIKIGAYLDVASK